MLPQSCKDGKQYLLAWYRWLLIVAASCRNQTVRITSEDQITFSTLTTIFSGQQWSQSQLAPTTWSEQSQRMSTSRARSMDLCHRECQYLPLRKLDRLLVRRQSQRVFLWTSSRHLRVWTVNHGLYHWKRLYTTLDSAPGLSGRLTKLSGWPSSLLMQCAIDPAWDWDGNEGEHYSGIRELRTDLAEVDAC